MPIIQLQFKGWLSYSETGGETVITIQGKLNLFDMIFLKFVSYEKMIISSHFLGFNSNKKYCKTKPRFECYRLKFSQISCYLFQHPITWKENV